MEVQHFIRVTAFQVSFKSLLKCQITLFKTEIWTLAFSVLLPCFPFLHSTFLVTRFTSFFHVFSVFSHLNESSMRARISLVFVFLLKNHQDLQQFQDRVDAELVVVEEMLFLFKSFHQLPIIQHIGCIVHSLLLGLDKSCYFLYDKYFFLIIKLKLHDQVVEKNQRMFICKLGEGANNSWYILDVIEIMNIFLWSPISLTLPFLALTLSAFH